MDTRILDLVRLFENGRISRRELIQALSLLVTAAGLRANAQRPTPRALKATGVNHISFVVSDYARTRDFYADLLSLRVERDDPHAKQCWLYLADGTHIVVQNPPTNSRSTQAAPVVNHFAVGIADWNKSIVESELRSRGVNYRASNGIPDDGFHLLDPDGYDLELVNEKRRG